MAQKNCLTIKFVHTLNELPSGSSGACVVCLIGLQRSLSAPLRRDWILAGWNVSFRGEVTRNPWHHQEANQPFGVFPLVCLLFWMKTSLNCKWEELPDDTKDFNCWDPSCSPHLVSCIVSSSRGDIHVFSSINNNQFPAIVARIRTFWLHRGVKNQLTTTQHANIPSALC